MNTPDPTLVTCEEARDVLLRSRKLLDTARLTDTEKTAVQMLVVTLGTILSLYTAQDADRERIAELESWLARIQKEADSVTDAVPF